MGYIARALTLRRSGPPNSPAAGGLGGAVEAGRSLDCSFEADLFDCPSSCGVEVQGFCPCAVPCGSPTHQAGTSNLDGGCHSQAEGRGHPDQASRQSRRSSAPRRSLPATGQRPGLRSGRPGQSVSAEWRNEAAYSFLLTPCTDFANFARGSACAGGTSPSAELLPCPISFPFEDALQFRAFQVLNS